MDVSAEFRNAFDEARRLHAAGQVAEAEQAYRRLAERGEQRPLVLEALTDLYVASGRAEQAVSTMNELVRAEPDNPYYRARLAGVLDATGQTDAAIRLYEQLLDKQPELAPVHFNLALLYKKQKRYEDALAAYRRAAELGIDRVQEVWSNMGVLYSDMRRPDEAREMYERALAADPAYVPALFNLAGLYEESGEREEALRLYERILGIEPGHGESLARIAHAQRVAGADDPLVGRLREALAAGGADAIGREALLFALGKTLDDAGSYDEAFAAYHEANELGKRRMPPYDPRAAEEAVEHLLSLFDREWLEGAQTDVEAEPVFIVGLFRSGSTLTEQILGAHPAVSAGGELDLVPWLIGRWLAPYPDRLRTITPEELSAVAAEYREKQRELFPEAARVTDKRPENFLHLGVIRAMFPRARIIHTRRHAPDNCLSIYFQQLGGNLGYSTDLADIAHYYRQHERIMAHWQSVFGDDMLTVDYDELVSDPEPVVRRLLEFVGLDWDDRVLAFQDADTRVKTASVWQVREGLQTRSSGRWKNYEQYLKDLRF
ncbi:MAG TPA: sulfotransferase [Woeseiaceae bacterium]|nr:sulfotransferase [Woeseiaceae bacterium]